MHMILKRVSKGAQDSSKISSHPGRIDKNLCRFFGAPARRVFPDHVMITRGAGHAFHPPGARLAIWPRGLGTLVSQSANSRTIPVSIFLILSIFLHSTCRFISSSRAVSQSLRQ